MSRLIRFEALDEIRSVRIVERKCRCRHAKLEIYETERIVKCKTCGKIVDPFDALVQLAHEEARLWNQCRQYEEAVKEFNKIESEWNLTIRERRKIQKAMNETRMCPGERE